MQSPNATSTANGTNPNTSWLNLRGTWLTNILLVVAFRAVFALIPGMTRELCWTLTNITYNIVTFFFFHWLLGTPFDINQGEYSAMTLWEQIDEGQQFTPTRKFLTAFPIFLFLLSTHYSRFDLKSFTINLIVLIVNLVGKMPFMDKVRLFGINKGE